MARLEDQSDKDMGEDDDETCQSGDDQSTASEEDSFVQVGRNIDDDNAKVAEWRAWRTSLTRTWAKMMTRPPRVTIVRARPAMSTDVAEVGHGWVTSTEVAEVGHGHKFPTACFTC